MKIRQKKVADRLKDRQLRHDMSAKDLKLRAATKRPGSQNPHKGR